MAGLFSPFHLGSQALIAPKHASYAVGQWGLQWLLPLLLANCIGQKGSHEPVDKGVLLGPSDYQGSFILLLISHLLLASSEASCFLQSVR